MNSDAQVRVEAVKVTFTRDEAETLIHEIRSVQWAVGMPESLFELVNVLAVAFKDEGPV